MRDTKRQVEELASKWLSFMSKEDFGAVILDLNASKAHLHYILSLKLAHWQELPWLLAVLGHTSETVARTGASKILGRFDGIGTLIVRKPESERPRAHNS